MTFNWEETLWAVGLRQDGRILFWAKIAIPKRQMAAMLREVADALESGNLEQVE